MNENLIKRIEALENEVRTLKSGPSFPFEIQKAIEFRGFVRTTPPAPPDFNGDYVSNEGFRRTIGLSGLEEDIVVPAYPLYFLKIQNEDRAENLYIPAYAYAELP
jgi:hypothetical protein